MLLLLLLLMIYSADSLGIGRETGGWNGGTRLPVLHP
jgi:hypothetical protein